jgi:hypothetical protein
MKLFGTKQSWPEFKVLSRHSPGGTEKNHKKTEIRSGSVHHPTTSFPTVCCSTLFLHL